MKITVKNFGPIDSFCYELEDDFLLIVGDNNIGKSYALSLVYLILKVLTRRQRTFWYYDEAPESRFPGVGSISKWREEIEKRFDAKDVSPTEICITDEFRAHAIGYFEAMILQPLQESLYGTFSELSNLQNRKSKNPVEITLETPQCTIAIQLKEGKVSIADIKLTNPVIVVRRVKTNRSTRESDGKTTVYYSTDHRRQFEVRYYGLLLTTHRRFLNAVSKHVIDIHYLPASRSGLYQALSAFGQIVAELSKNRTMLSKKIELPGISEPLSDYFIKLSEVRPSSSHGDSPYLVAAAEIEKSVLKGVVDVDSKTKRITFSQSDIDLKLDLSATSSMVSEISPIVSYLKYVLPRIEAQAVNNGNDSPLMKQVLFIEEPEAHLHPEIQVLLTTIFALIVKTTRTKIVMTSHSNYVFNKISNLIIDKSIDREHFKALIFERTETGSSARQVQVSEYGIVDENFADVSESIYQERIKLIDSLN